MRKSRFSLGKNVSGGEWGRGKKEKQGKKENGIEGRKGKGGEGEKVREGG